jgi:HPt (histidine-containing phosphotransfer) domain-containing protein
MPFVQRVLSTYLVSLARHVEAVQMARAASDLPGLRAVAHTLKSSSESIGAVSFARRCAALDSTLRERLANGQGADEGLLADVDQFLLAAAQVRVAVQAELGGVTPS